jgi:lipopolysaccharide/colanic/teichoic acid biosynthesis glycosyltransferase
MSVVGPRPERPELDTDMERSAPDWRRRWFVRPGLTGLAQVRGVTAFDPEGKLRYDVEYIRRQSLRFDLRILLRQLWGVAADVEDLLTDRR